MNGPLVFDDYHLPFADPYADRMTARFWIGGVRPLLSATYWANYALSGTRTFFYHLTNFGFHIASTVLAFFVLKRLLAMAGTALNRTYAALFGAAVFLLHPLQTEAVDYLAGRSETLCGLFMLLAWLIFLQHFEGAVSIRITAAILLCAGAAVLSKESGVAIAGLILATDLFWWRGNHRDRRILYVSFLIGAGGAVFLILKKLTQSTSAGAGSGIGPMQYAMTECRAIITYLRLFLIPVGQNADWQMQIYRSPGESWIYVTLFAALVCGAALLYWRARLVCFGIAVFLIGLAPTSSFIPIQDAMAERRMYLPILGLILALIGTVQKIRIPVMTLRIGAVALVCLYCSLTYTRSRVWSSDEALWRDCLLRNPANSRAHAGLGGALMLQHQCAAAAREYQTVIDTAGFDPTNGQNLAAAYECTQQRDLAMAMYRRVVSKKPTAEAYTRIGYLEGLQENAGGAMESFNAALRLNPYYAQAYVFRGLVFAAQNNLKDAKIDFQRALSLDPANSIALNWLAKLQ